MLLLPSRKVSSIDSITVGFEKSTQKEMTTAIEKFCWDNNWESFMNVDKQHRRILRYCCQVKKINPLCKCKFEIIAKTIQRNNEDICRIESIYLEHEECCIGVKPQPSLEYFLRHQNIKAYAIHNRVSKIIQHLNLCYNFQITKSMASRLKTEASRTHFSEKDLSYKGIESWLKKFVELNPECR